MCVREKGRRSVQRILLCAPGVLSLEILNGNKLMCTRSTGLDKFSATHLGIPATFWKLFALLDDFSPSSVWRLVCARARIRAAGTTEQ